jgi:hypothetical protein
MANDSDIEVCGFVVKGYHPLTEPPEAKKDSPQNATGTAGACCDATISSPATAVPEALRSLSPSLVKLSYDIVMYLYSSINVRIKRLAMSCSKFEQAKEEGFERKLFFPSSAGQPLYLIPYPSTFAIFDQPCPYANIQFVEHSFYVCWAQYVLKHNPGYKDVIANVKIGQNGRIADLLTVTHSGQRLAWEVTLSTGNILTHAAAYAGTDVRLTFLAKNHKLREAVRACCREGGLDPDLLAKIDYMHFSQLLQRQRSLYRY